MEQRVFTNTYQIDDYLRRLGVKRILLVCGPSANFLNVYKYFSSIPRRLEIEVVRFSGYKSNPEYRSVEDGLMLFHKVKADMIVALGGGSAIDVAKCIKLFSNMDGRKNYLRQEILANEVPFLAVPTTAGTGSEATRFAVIYYKGEKQSITHETAIPNAVLLDPSVLESLPDYQRKATMMDAFCHGIESFWSVNSTKESRAYSKEAIQLITKYGRCYLENRKVGNAAMLKAANIAGKAINIAQTTAGHAMCYKLTSFLGIAHGHAAALCVSRLWYYMLENVDKCIDKRGEMHLQFVFSEIAEAMEARDAKDAANQFSGLLDELALPFPKEKNVDLNILAESVNPVRLKNNPVTLTTEEIMKLYQDIIER